MIAAITQLVRQRWFVLLAFLLEHLWLIWQGLKGIGIPMGDINFAYLPWLQQMQMSHRIMGIDTPWVYPFPDELFIWLPHWINPHHYEYGWLTMSVIIDFAAAVVLLYWPRRWDGSRILAAWFWMAAQIFLGPVSISRLDTVSIAFAVVGLVAWLRAKPSVAAAWFAVATWIKVWPVTLLAATIAEARRWKPAAIAGLGTGLIILVAGIAMGGLHNTLSFVTDQTDRGIQIESPWAAPWIWGRVFHLPGYDLYYSETMKTFQVAGPGADWLASVLGPLMYLALAITLVLGWSIIRRGDLEDLARRNEVFAWTVLTAILDMIVFNKVGSPQYYGWLIVPAILGLIENVPDWRKIAGWILGIVSMTGFIYPTIYGLILRSDSWPSAMLTARNLATVALLVLANGRLIELALEQFRKKRTDQVLLD